MEHFSEELSKHLLSKEWLAKTDNEKSIPYLMKFYSSSVDLSCCVLVTDTKSAWAEVLTSSQFARRWRQCNPGSPEPYNEAEDEDTWRTATLDLLSKGHTLGGLADISFDVTASNFSDFSFQLQSEHFKWRWETNFLGSKASSEIISQHLVLPLISLTHMAFSSVEALSGMTDADIEKSIDKVGRTARRTLDIHIKNTISRPRISTSLRRMTAMFNYATDLPSVRSEAEKPDLVPEEPPQITESYSKLSAQQLLSPPGAKFRSKSPARPDKKQSDVKSTAAKQSATPETEVKSDSSTEPEDEDDSKMLSQRLKPPSSASVSRKPTPRVSPATGTSGPRSSDSESSPVRPKKKLKQPTESSSDDGSEEERKRHVAQLKSGNAVSGIRSGARQPIKRSVKRF